MPTLHIIDESSDYIVIDKPPGIQVHPSKPGGPPTLWDHLRGLLAFEIANGGQISIINRLDRETSGIVLVCKHSASARMFSRLMQQRLIAKEYLALVHGWPAQDSFTIDVPILRQGSRIPSRIWLKQMPHPEGAPALTKFEVIARSTHNTHPVSLVRAIPETGRMHQIRVHLSYAGHPVIGDKIYGSSEQHYLTFIETGWTQTLAEALWLPRHALHSARITIDQPGAAHDWQSPLPPDLAEWLGGEKATKNSQI
jgi:23S rRNA pseudouridine1911/1915/1917 synthase